MALRTARSRRSTYRGDENRLGKRSSYYLALGGIGCAIIVAFFLMPDQFAQSLRSHAMGVFGPLIRTVEIPIHYFSRVDKKLATLEEAQAEVTKLRGQVSQLQLRNQFLTDKTAENAKLREMLGYREASQYRLLACRVVSREPTSWWDSVQVNVGWADNPDLAKDQPVVTPRGVVGKTGTVSQYVTDIILMVNENCSISATVDGTHDQGIVQGQGNFEEGKPRVKVKYLPKNSDVAKGNFLVTSGLGPYFPAGLRLGSVVDVPALKNEYPTFGLYREAIIEPTADLNQLDELFIVLGPKDKKDKDKPDNTTPATPGTSASSDASDSSTSDSTTTTGTK
jgi:rod shape-determining protein MreC